MGVRKRNSAQARKDALKDIAFAKLTNVPSSPRKMRLVADLVRGKEVFRALGILKFSNKEAPRPSPTGRPKTTARLNPANSISPLSSLTRLPCSSVFAQLPRAAVTVSANVPTT